MLVSNSCFCLLLFIRLLTVRRHYSRQGGQSSPHCSPSPSFPPLSFTAFHEHPEHPQQKHQDDFTPQLISSTGTRKAANSKPRKEVPLPLSANRLLEQLNPGLKTNVHRSQVFSSTLHLLSKHLIHFRDCNDQKGSPCCKYAMQSGHQQLDAFQQSSPKPKGHSTPHTVSVALTETYLVSALRTSLVDKREIEIRLPSLNVLGVFLQPEAEMACKQMLWILQLFTEDLLH